MEIFFIINSKSFRQFSFGLFALNWLHFCIPTTFLFYLQYTVIQNCFKKSVKFISIMQWNCRQPLSTFLHCAKCQNLPLLYVPYIEMLKSMLFWNTVESFQFVGVNVCGYSIFSWMVGDWFVASTMQDGLLLCNRLVGT